MTTRFSLSIDPPSRRYAHIAVLQQAELDALAAASTSWPNDRRPSTTTSQPWLWALADDQIRSGGSWHTTLEAEQVDALALLIFHSVRSGLLRQSATNARVCTKDLTTTVKRESGSLYTSPHILQVFTEPWTPAQSNPKAWAKIKATLTALRLLLGANLKGKSLIYRSAHHVKKPQDFA